MKYSSLVAIIVTAVFWPVYASAQTVKPGGAVNGEDAATAGNQVKQTAQSARRLEALPQLPHAEVCFLPTIVAPPNDSFQHLLVIDTNDGYPLGNQLIQESMLLSQFQSFELDSISLEAGSKQFIDTTVGHMDAEPVFLLSTNQFDLNFLWPVETRTISSAWGPRIRTATVVVKTPTGSRRVRRAYDSTHKGIDLTAPRGHSVFAAMDGRISAVGRDRKLGFFVKIDHGNGLETLYGHNSVNLVAVEDFVLRGQIIARVGSTGNSTGPHVHFEVRIDGQPVNPGPWLNDTEEISAEIATYNDKFKQNGFKRK